MWTTPWCLELDETSLMPSTPQRSICVARCSLGPTSARPRRRSSCTHFSTCAAPSRPSSTSPRRQAYARRAVCTCPYDLPVGDARGRKPVYVMDRAYVDFGDRDRLHTLHRCARLLRRARQIQRHSELRRRVTRARSTAPPAVICDQTMVVLTGVTTRRQLSRQAAAHQGPCVEGAERGKTLELFLTNSLALGLAEVGREQRETQIDHRRALSMPKWRKSSCSLASNGSRAAPAHQILLRHLRELGAVRTQIWIAVSVYVLVAISCEKMTQSGPQPVHNVLPDPRAITVIRQETADKSRALTRFKSNDRPKTGF